MKYISIDIETTDLNPETGQILSFGAIIEDTENLLSFDKIPKFYRLIHWEQIKGSTEALAMNGGTLQEIADAIKTQSSNLIKIHQLSDVFSTWLNTQELEDKYVIAGANYQAFDDTFLCKVEHWEGWIKQNCYSRVLDPSILLIDWKTDHKLPSLQICLDRCGIQKSVTHNALEDAWDVIQCNRVVTNNYTKSFELK